MILILLKNHFKRSRSTTFKPNAKNIGALLALVVLSLGLVGLMGYILYQITVTFERLRLEDVYLTVILFILMLVLILYEIFNIIKQLYTSKDNQIYLKLPIEKEALFTSKLIYIYLKQIMIALVFLAVTAGVYGLVSNATIFYFMRLVIISIFLPLLTISVSSLLSIPAFYLVEFIKRHKVILMGSLLIIIGTFFAAYISFVQVIFTFIGITEESGDNIISAENIENIKGILRAMPFSKTIQSLLVYSSLRNFFHNFGVTLLIMSLFVSISFIVLRKFYFKLLEGQNNRLSEDTKRINKASKPFMSIFKKEMKILIRNPNYAFQAIIMNLLMPLFIFFTIQLTAKAAEMQVGNEIIPGITILTVLIFVLLSNGFQGAIISKEKDAHYISKIIPVKPFKQIIAKMAFGYILSTVMLIISVVLVASFGYIDPFQAIFVIIISVMFLFGYTFSLVYHDYKNPQLTSNEGGFDEGLNMYKVLLTALVIAVVLGLVNIGIPYIMKLFPDIRTFGIPGVFIFDLTAERVNMLLNLFVFVTVLTYGLLNFVKLVRLVRKQ